MRTEMRSFRRSVPLLALAILAPLALTAAEVLVFEQPQVAGIAGQYSVVAANCSGSTTSSVVTLTVHDTTSPAISSCPTNRTLLLGGTCQVALPDLTGELVATDCNGPLTITQDPLPGVALGLGPHLVTITVKDAANNASNCTVSVTVVDTQPPQITCPGNITTNGPAEGQIASFTPNATDVCTVTNVACNPPSGSTFSIGTNTVTCTAQDSSGNTAQCAFAGVVEAWLVVTGQVALEFYAGPARDGDAFRVTLPSATARLSADGYAYVATDRLVATAFGAAAVAAEGVSAEGGLCLSNSVTNDRPTVDRFEYFPHFPQTFLSV